MKADSKVFNDNLESGNKTLNSNGNGKSEYYTGQKSKVLFVHVMQDGIEITKPVKTKIYEQSVQWKDRKWPIVSSRFYYDYSGIAHQQVDVNDVSVLTFHKDHTDTCKKCGGKMTVDSRNARVLGRKGIFTNLWGIDNTHMILIIVGFIIGFGGIIAGMYFYADSVKYKTQNEGYVRQLSELKATLGIIEQQNPNQATGTH